jgi:hypothetical protein
MKILIFGIILYAAVFGTAYFWDADAQKRAAQDRDLAKQGWAEVSAAADKDLAIS